MASEKFSNLGETTLAAGYTSGGTTLSVAAAGSFPSVGVFRVRLGNANRTIWRVDSVSGTTFTGAAEANDGNANSGDAVKIVASKSVAERFTQAPEPNESILVSGANAVDEYFTFLTKTKRLDQSGWTWLQQGSAAVNQANGLVRITGHSAAGTQIRGRYFAYPTAPFTIIAGFRPTFPGATNLANLAALAIGGYESGTGKMVLLNAANFDYSNGNALNGNFAFQGMTNTTTTATLYGQHKGGTNFNAVGINNFIPPFHLVWLKYEDNNTNVIASWSWDKINWNQIVSQARATGYTTMADKFGWFMQLQSASISTPDLGYIVSWEQS